MMNTSEDVELEPICFTNGLFRHDIYQPAGYVLPRAYRPLYKPILELPIRKDDVWVVTHPKCGTTWVSELVWLIRHDLDYEAAKTTLIDRVPFVEFSSLFLNGEERKEEEESRKKLPRRFADSVGVVNEWDESKGPRTIKSHLPWQTLPKSLRKPDSPGKIIYVAREPKDVCISYYHHHKLLENYKGTLEEFAEHFLSDRLMFGPFWTHLLEFWNRRNQQNVLFLKFEDMKKDLSSVIRQVNTFLNLPHLTEEQIQGLKDHLSFKRMRDNKAVNMSTLIQNRKEKGILEVNSSDRFMRKGIVGDWKNEISPDTARRFDEWSAKKTAGSGLTFSCHEDCSSQESSSTGVENLK